MTDKNAVRAGQDQGQGAAKFKKAIIQSVSQYLHQTTMPSAVPELYQYSHVQETEENLDWADRGYSQFPLHRRPVTDTPAVPTVDLSKYGTPEGNAELSQVLIEAVRTKGFFYVTNFGIPQEVIDKQFYLGQKFYELPLEEKLKYEPDLENGDYNGYRPAGRRLLSGGIKDKTEVWNMASEWSRMNFITVRMILEKKPP